MKILITGCAGFIGSHLSEKLLKNNHLIYGIDNINDYYDQSQKNNNLKILYKYNNFHFKKDDIVTTNIISEIKPDIVVNIAAMAGVRYSIENPSIYMKVNIEGQVNLLKQSVENNVKLFVYASSSSVYGLNQKIPFNENDTINNVNSPYAASKKSGEIMAKLYHDLYKLPVIGLRFFTVYGPRGRPDMAPFKFLNSIINQNEFMKYGNGESYRDYTYIDDIVNGIIGAINNKKSRTCEVYNLGNSKPITLNQFINTCEQVSGKKAIFKQISEQKGDVPYTYADIQKAKDDLDYSPKTTFKEGIKLTYEWMISK
tara:strand:+ start:166 stop:1104 length:939 start_codon:yes stop_codon:yes gene_type:complete